MEDIIRLLNHWWREGAVKESFAKEYKRECFGELLNLLDHRQVIVICGLRRVGKSTLMYQLMQHLIAGGSNPLNVLYFSFDKKIGEIKAVLDSYAKITEKDYENEKIFVFLDEVYKLKKWHRELKLLYDALPNVKFVVSGSASLKIEREARSDLTGRAFYVEVKPLSFTEFFELKFKTKLENPKIWEEKLKAIFPGFLKKAFPEIIDFEPEMASDYVKDLVLDKILFSDSAAAYKNVDLNLLQTLTEIFLSEPGIYLNTDSLSKDLKKSKNDINSHIRLLELGYVIRIVKNFRGSVLSASRKLRRVYPYHPSLIQGILKEVVEPKMVECFVRSHLDAEFYWRKEKREVDFVHKGMPVEVKYSDNIQKHDFRNMLEFMEQFNVTKGRLISKNQFDEFNTNGKTIKVLPAWQFALESFED